MATIYYVAPGGSNAAAGTSLGTAWQTIAFAMGATSPVVGGDTIYVRSGTPYTQYVTVGRAGTPGNPITLDTYAPDLPVKARITTGGVLGGIYNAISSNWTIKNLEIDTTTGGAGIYFDDAPGMAANAAWVIDSCHIHHNVSGDNASGIYIQRQRGSITIQNCVLHDNLINPPGPTSGYNATGVVVFGFINPGSPGACTVRFLHNEVYAQPVGFKIKHLFASDNIFTLEVAYNYFHGITGRADIEVAGTDATRTNAGNSKRVHHNLMVNHTTGAACKSGADFGDWDTTWDHNTVYNCESGFTAHREDASNESHRNFIYDNIWVPIAVSAPPVGYGVSLETTVAPLNTFDYNNFWNVTPNTTVATISGVGNQSLAGWQASTNLPDAHGTRVDPLFVNVASDWHLQSGSPCRNSDRTGNDKGCYELRTETMGPMVAPVVAASSAGRALATTSLTISHTVPAGANGYLVVLANVSTSTVASATYGGVSLTRTSDVLHAINGRLVVLTLANPAVGTANLVLTGSVSGNLSACVVSLTGCGYVSALFPVIGTGTAPSLLVPATATDLVLDLCLTSTASITYTGGAGQTSLVQQDGLTGTAGRIAVSWKAGTAASAPMTWTLSTSAAYHYGALVVSPVAPTGLTRVQTTGLAAASATNTLVVTFQLPPKVGNAVLLAVSSTAPITTCVENQGNAFTAAVSETRLSTNTAAIYSCPVLAATGSPYTVTLSTGGAANLFAVGVEVSRVGTGLAVDKTVKANGTTAATAATGATAALAVAEAFLVAALQAPSITSAVVEAVVPAWGPETEIFTNSLGEIDSRVVGSAAGTTQSVSWAIAPSNAWVAVLAAFGAALVDTTAPVLTKIFPSGSLVSPASGTQQLWLTTDEAATAKYSTTPGQAFSAMPSTFTTTGGTTHQVDVAIVEGGAYTYYVKAQDAAGNASADFVISFTVDSYPVVSAGSPAGMLAFGTTSATLRVTTSEPTVVRYALTPGQSFASMSANQFSVTNGTTHSTVVSGLTNGQTYTFYIKAQESGSPFSLITPADYVITFRVASSVLTVAKSNDLTTMWVDWQRLLRLQNGGGDLTTLVVKEFPAVRTAGRGQDMNTDLFTYLKNLP